MRGKKIKRGVFLFLAGLFAGFAIEHAVIGIFISNGTLNRPHVFGRDWGGESGLVGAAFYSAISVWMGYVAWRAPKSPEGERK